MKFSIHRSHSGFGNTATKNKQKGEIGMGESKGERTHPWTNVATPRMD